MADTADAAAAAAPPATDASGTPTVTAGVGIIYPPPELRNIVDKTAQFVAKPENGWDFVERIREEKKGEAKFNFLKANNPYHGYFLHRIDEFKDGVSLAAGTDAVEVEDGAVANARHAVEPMEAPPEPEFTINPPTIAAMDLDIVKLMAQFVARNGNHFLQKIVEKESRNHQFDFLKPQHTMFNYFMELTEQYKKILIPKAEMLTSLKVDTDRNNILGRLRRGAAWSKHQRSRQEQEAAEAEKERTSYAQIDWHDFSIVATIEFTAEDADLPPPITPESLGFRLIEMERQERARQEQAAAQPQTEDVEMEMDSGDEEEVVQPAAPAAAPKIVRAYDPKAAKAAPPAKGPAETTAGGAEMLVSPLTGELIPAKDYSEHMRIGLLDPRWREDKAKQQEIERERKKTWQQQSSAAMSHLKDMASRRTDIFGSGDVETDIGQKMGDDTLKEEAAAKVSWDGQSQASSITALVAKSAVAQIKEASEKSSRTARKEEPPKAPEARPAAGPPPTMAPSTAAAPSAPRPSNPPTAPAAAPAAPSAPSAPLAGPPRAPTMHPSRAPPTMAPAPVPSRPVAPPPMSGPPPRVGGANSVPTGGHASASGMPGRPRMGGPSLLGLPPAAASTPSQPLAANGGEPPAKRPKAEEQKGRLLPEKEFLATHDGSFSVTVTAGTAIEQFKIEAGKTVTVNMQYSDKVANLKAQLKAILNLPPGKQKLQADGLVLNNVNSLAFYNITADTSLTLSLKSRGGKK